MEAVAWQAYRENHKSPFSEKAGPEFADPEYQLSVQWKDTRNKLRAAAARQRDASTPSTVLVVHLPTGWTGWD